MTHHAKWWSGSHSRRLGGNNNSCSRSHARKFCGIPESRDSGMPQNFLACDREQELLLPPSLREWLPDHHLAWCVIDAVAELDLAAFYVAYRADGWGRAAHEPALLLYAYALGERSSR